MVVEGFGLNAPTMFGLVFGTLAGLTLAILRFKFKIKITFSVLFPPVFAFLAFLSIIQGDVNFFYAYTVLALTFFDVTSKQLSFIVNVVLVLLSLMLAKNVELFSLLWFVAVMGVGIGVFRLIKPLVSKP